jgi:hypothetical protein
VGAAVATILDANIRDRRPWARGAFHLKERTAGDYSTSSGAVVDIDTTNLTRRIECSGVPMRVALLGTLQESVVNMNVQLQLWIDGASAVLANHRSGAAVGDFDGGVLLEHTFIPAAGSHVFVPRWIVEGGTAILRGSAGNSNKFLIEEHVRQEMSNT